MKRAITEYIKYLAIIGNAAYFLWVIYNAIDEGGREIGIVQGIAYIGVLVLFIFNILLLSRLKN